MRLIATKSTKPGTLLGQAVFNSNGQILIQKGMALTERMITRLIEQGVTYIYIEDDFTKDVQINPAISEKVRIEATHAIKDIFEEVRKQGIESRSFILSKDGPRLMTVIDQIIKEITSREETLSLLGDIFITDNYIFEHSLNVTIYALAIGTELNLPQNELTELGIGAMLHDIGKIFIDQEILQKQGQLTDEEFEIIKTHAELGFQFLRQQSEISCVAAHCAYQHHERLDGSGYPRGLKEDKIHTFAKIIGIADVFDAVTSNRVYREAMLPHKGLEILYAGAVQLFDKKMVEAFKRSVSVYPNGLTVELNDGRKGIVIKQHQHLCDRPVIRILEERNIKLQNTYEVDLSTIHNVVISGCEK